MVIHAVKTKNRVAKYLDYEVEVGTDTSDEEVRDNLATIFPELGNAQMNRDTLGNLSFLVIAGTKG